MESVCSKLDLMIDQILIGFHEKQFFLLSKSNYKKLCIELKRNVRTYKGYKVRSM